jgi:predicted small metal-binding protein
MALPPVLKVNVVDSRLPTALLVRRRRQQEVSRFYAQRAERNQLVPQGAPGTGPVVVEDFEKVVLQKDHLNYVGDHGSQSPGLVEVEVTRDSDGGMRLWGDPEVHLTVKNTSGVTINAGTPVYATGTVGATSTIEIAAADAGNSAKMPAIGLLEQTLAHNAFGTLMVVGVLRQQNTGSYSINQTLYVANGGGLTGTRPTATTQLVQNIGRVVRVNGSSGEILVYGAGRTNDVPNYAATKLLGRGSASGAGAAQEITVGSGLTMVGTTVSAAQDIFRNILVAGQNTIVASGSSDSLEFVAGSGITLTTDDTLKTVTIDATGGGGGGGGNTGKTTVDFGAFPGSSDAMVTVTGQTGIVSGSVVQAWLICEATADHTADEHRVETISVTCGNIVANTSFDIYAQNTSQLTERLASHTPSTFRSTAAAALGDSQPSIGGQGTRLYGAWSVAWRWS